MTELLSHYVSDIITMQQIYDAYTELCKFRPDVATPRTLECRYTLVVLVVSRWRTNEVKQSNKLCHKLVDMRFVAAEDIKNFYLQPFPLVAASRNPMQQILPMCLVNLQMHQIYKRVDKVKVNVCGGKMFCEIEHYPFVIEPNVHSMFANLQPRYRLMYGKNRNNWEQLNDLDDADEQVKRMIEIMGTVMDTVNYEQYE